MQLNMLQWEEWAAMTSEAGKHSLVRESAVETTYPDGTTRYDYRTAHHRAGDPDYQKAIPETCTKCEHQRLAAEEEGDPPPTKPDEAI